MIEKAVFSGGTYYWFYSSDLTWKNTFDESEIGITTMEFYPMDTYCYFWYERLNI